MKSIQPSTFIQDHLRKIPDNGYVVIRSFLQDWNKCSRYATFLSRIVTLSLDESKKDYLVDDQKVEWDLGSAGIESPGQYQIIFFNIESGSVTIHGPLSDSETDEEISNNAKYHSFRLKTSQVILMQYMLDNKLFEVLVRAEQFPILKHIRENNYLEYAIMKHCLEVKEWYPDLSHMTFGELITDETNIDNITLQGAFLLTGVTCGFIQTDRAGNISLKYSPQEADIALGWHEFMVAEIPNKEKFDGVEVPFWKEAWDVNKSSKHIKNLQEQLGIHKDKAKDIIVPLCPWHTKASQKYLFCNTEGVFKYEQNDEVVDVNNHRTGKIVEVQNDNAYIVQYDTAPLEPAARHVRLSYGDMWPADQYHLYPPLRSRRFLKKDVGKHVYGWIDTGTATSKLFSESDTKPDTKSRHHVEAAKDKYFHNSAERSVTGMHNYGIPVTTTIINEQELIINNIDSCSHHTMHVSLTDESKTQLNQKNVKDALKIESVKDQYSINNPWLPLQLRAIRPDHVGWIVCKTEDIPDPKTWTDAAGEAVHNATVAMAEGGRALSNAAGKTAHDAAVAMAEGGRALSKAAGKTAHDATVAMAEGGRALSKAAGKAAHDATVAGNQKLHDARLAMLGEEGVERSGKLSLAQNPFSAFLHFGDASKTPLEQKYNNFAGPWVSTDKISDKFKKEEHLQFRTWYTITSVPDGYSTITATSKQSGTEQQEEHKSNTRFGVVNPTTHKTKTMKSVQQIQNLNMHPEITEVIQGEFEVDNVSSTGGKLCTKITKDGTEYKRETKYYKAGQLTWAKAVNLLTSEEIEGELFRNDLTQTIRYGMRKPAVYFECFPYKSDDSPFEFVLIDAADDLDTQADPHKFKNKFTLTNTENNIRYFKSTSDTCLIAPEPTQWQWQYSTFSKWQHIVSFFTHAKDKKLKHSLWKTVGERIKSLRKHKNNVNTVWLSTDGRSVPWLHVRVSIKPDKNKLQYKYTPFLKYQQAQTKAPLQSQGPGFAEEIEHNRRAIVIEGAEVFEESAVKYYPIALAIDRLTEPFKPYEYGSNVNTSSGRGNTNWHYYCSPLFELYGTCSSDLKDSTNVFTLHTLLKDKPVFRESVMSPVSMNAAIFTSTKEVKSKLKEFADTPQVQRHSEKDSNKIYIDQNQVSQILREVVYPAHLRRH